MSSRRRKIWATVPATLAVAALAPAVAAANPLLSGYGGPGQGDQAILGATMLNTPRGGGGSSSSGGGSPAAGATSLTVASASNASAAGGPATGRKAHRRHAGSTGAAGRAKTNAASHANVPSGGLVRNAAATTAASGGSLLGLSGGDVLYLLLALAALALTGGLTRQMARRPH